MCSGFAARTPPAPPLLKFTRRKLCDRRYRLRLTPIIPNACSRVTLWVYSCRAFRPGQRLTTEQKICPPVHRLYLRSFAVFCRFSRRWICSYVLTYAISRGLGSFCIKSHTVASDRMARCVMYRYKQRPLPVHNRTYSLGLDVSCSAKPATAAAAL